MKIEFNFAAYDKEGSEIPAPPQTTRQVVASAAAFTVWCRNLAVTLRGLPQSVARLETLLPHRSQLREEKGRRMAARPTRGSQR